MRRRAFTLIELLVVLGIITVLVAFLMPMLARVQQSARNSGCLSNLRQIMSAVIIYAADNDKMLPYSGTGGFGWPDESFNHGLRLLKPYVPNPSFFVCPSDTNPPFNVYWSTVGWGSQNGFNGLQYPWPSSYYYGFANYHRFVYTPGAPGNNWEGSSATQMKITDIRSPGRRGIFQCAAVWGGSASHGPGGMLNFIDGHSQYARPAELTNGVMGGSDLGYWHFDWTVNGLAGADLK